MHKTLVILRHEFIQTITRRGFIVMGIIFPLIMLLAIGVYQIVKSAGQGAPPQTTTIGYVDNSGLLAAATGEYGTYKIVPFDTAAAATSALTSGNISEYIVVPITSPRAPRPSTPRKSSSSSRTRHWRYCAPSSRTTCSRARSARSS